MNCYLEDEISLMETEKKLGKKYKDLEAHPRWKCIGGILALFLLFAYNTNLYSQIFSCPDCDKQFEVRPINKQWAECEANWKCLRCGKQNWKMERPYVCANCHAHIGEK